MRLIKADLNPSEKRTFSLHMIYSLIEGVIFGVLALNEYVFLRTLHGTEYELSFLFQFSVVVFVFLIFINEFLNRIKNRKLLLRITGFVTRGPLFLLLFFPASHLEMSQNAIYHIVFLALFFLYYLGNTIIYPTINLYLKSSYSHQHFGYLYSFAQSSNKIVVMFVTIGYGVMLDIDNFAFREVFAVVAILGVISTYLLSMIKFDVNILPQIKDSGFFSSIKTSVKRMWNIVTKNRPYLHFEVGFMLYGFAFMSTTTVINIFFERGLGMNYSSYAFYKNVYNILAIISLPFFGRLLGKIDPRRFAVITYAAMMFYLIFMALTVYYPEYWETPEFLVGGKIIPSIRLYPMLLIAYLSYSIFAATMVLLWNIGSAYFCKNEDAGDYQSVHLSLTGMRAIFAPAVGVLIFEIAGFAVTFFVGAFALFAAVLVMIWSYKRNSH